MKRFKVWVLVLSFMLTAMVHADQDGMVGFWFGFPKIPGETAVTGLRLGLPGSSGGPVTLNGLELSIFCSSSEVLNGMQLTLCGPALAGWANGFQLSLVNRVRTNIDGVQLGVVNLSYKDAGIQIGLVNHVSGNAGLQIGLLNFNPKGLIPFMVLINFGGGIEAN